MDGYIADRKSRGKLAPKPRARWSAYRLMEWLSFINSKCTSF